MIPQAEEAPCASARSGYTGLEIVKEFNMSKYYLLQDADLCIGCSSCEVSCKINKGLGPGPALCQNILWGPVLFQNLPRVRFVFMPCFHCEEPWCLKVCPSGAVMKRATDGIVYIDPARCIGCKCCISACPWGACQWDPVTQKSVKCDYCKDRLDAGLKPACVTTCVTGCLDFGIADKLPDYRRQRHARVLAEGVLSSEEQRRQS
jgi:Fe-S-cluster-containing dehydrogenase component